MTISNKLDNKQTSGEWFCEWFDTPYYHTLYKHRNDEEAEHFISGLCKELNIQQGTKVLDLACGKGRHAKMLQQQGLDVLGVDLSANSIAAARKLETNGLRFAVHDMRDVLLGERFGFVFNFFTSFGYFDGHDDNLKVLRAIYKILDQDGILVIDFMNVKKVIERLVADEIRTEDGIHFHIQRRFDGEHIFKNIQFEDQGKHFNFTERVQALLYSDFISLLEQAEFEIIRTFGNFDLDPFEEDTSQRLILVCKRNT